MFVSERDYCIFFSLSAIRTSSKRQFVDPSIATAVMKMEPESILMDFE